MEDFLRLGLLNWYPLEVSASILVVSEDDILEKEFRRRGLQTRRICDIQTFEGQCQYDYIVIENGDVFMWSLCDKDIEIKKMLKPQGHLLFACRNRLALRYFVGDVDPYSQGSFDGIEDYCNYTEEELRDFSGRCYSKNEIEKFILKIGFSATQYRGYSVFPGLEMPQLIYAWDYLPQENMASRYTPLYHDAHRIFLTETNLSDSLIENGMFHIMANAYLIDCSMDGHFYEFDQVTTSMERGEENATATIVQRDGVVIKKALYPAGNRAIRTLMNNMERLKRRGMRTVDQTLLSQGVCDGKELLGVQMKRVRAPLAMTYLRELLYKDQELFVEKVSQFMELVLASGDEIKAPETELGMVYQEVYFDLVPINSFVVNGEFVFFDQEYVIQEFPINVVLTRVLDFVYMGNKKAANIVPMSYFTEKFHLADKISVYRNMSSVYLSKLKHATDLITFHREHKADGQIINMNRQKMQYDIQMYISLFINYLNNTEGKKVYLFGSGLWARKFVAEYGDTIAIEGMLDNNAERWGKKIDGISVLNPYELRKLDPSVYKVIVCVKQHREIIRQLNIMGVTSYGIYDPNIDVGGMLETRNMRYASVHHASAQKDDLARKKQYHMGFVAGVFDLFHVGHLNLLREAKEKCDILLVGIVSDEQASSGKEYSPYVSQQERMEIVEACKYVDQVFIIPAAAASARDIFKKYHFDVMFSGDDYREDSYWMKEQEWLRAHGSDIVFFPYTQTTSSTKLKKAINETLGDRG